MASQPTEMSSRNWIMRRLITDTIRNDPEWNNGDYTKQPRSARVASVFYDMATNGGNLALQKMAPTRELADKLLDQRLTARFDADAFCRKRPAQAARKPVDSRSLHRTPAAARASVGSIASQLCCPQRQPIVAVLLLAFPHRFSDRVLAAIKRGKQALESIHQPFVLPSTRSARVSLRSKQRISWPDHRRCHF
jgi:hypothetical protein